MTLFDSTGKLIDKDGLKSVNMGKGRAIKSSIVDGNKVTEVVNDYTGASAGFHVEHGSGRIDAVVKQ